MLFLLNDQIVEVEVPELHLERRASVLGCGDPHTLRARDALDYAARMIAAVQAEGQTLQLSVAEDLAALIITKTGANAALFPDGGESGSEPRLTILPEAILEQLRAREEALTPVDLAAVWPLAA